MDLVCLVNLLFWGGGAIISEWLFGCPVEKKRRKRTLARQDGKLNESAIMWADLGNDL